MLVQTASLVSFAVITTFTPGPNNITSASMGLNYGYQRSFPYLAGIFSGFFVIMLVTAFLSETILSLIPGIQGILSIIGALYILWLAWHTFKSDYNFTSEENVPMGFIKGMLLQLLNIKVIIYGLTIYSTFLVELPLISPLLPLSAFLLAFTSFSSITLWTLFGTAIRSIMKNATIRKGINLILSLTLVYTAISMSGLLKLIA